MRLLVLIVFVLFHSNLMLYLSFLSRGCDAGKRTVMAAKYTDSIAKCRCVLYPSSASCFKVIIYNYAVLYITFFAASCTSSSPAPLCNISSVTIPLSVNHTLPQTPIPMEVL
jgi:hypothetical protein